MSSHPDDDIDAAGSSPEGTPGPPKVDLVKGGSIFEARRANPDGPVRSVSFGERNSTLVPPGMSTLDLWGVDPESDSSEADKVALTGLIPRVPMGPEDRTEPPPSPSASDAPHPEPKQPGGAQPEPPAPRRPSPASLANTVPLEVPPPAPSPSTPPELDEMRPSIQIPRAILGGVLGTALILGTVFLGMWAGGVTAKDVVPDSLGFFSVETDD